MKHTDFTIGLTFYMSGKQWRCTDTGTRVITAIQTDDRTDQSWYNGPPYGVPELVIDENDIGACSTDPASITDFKEQQEKLEAAQTSFNAYRTLREMFQW